MAPTALRRPISRVRSVTETSMMFMMPMPPTNSEMPAMMPRKMVSTLVIWLSAPISSAWLRMVKSSSSRKAMPREPRRASCISTMAASWRSSLTTWARI